MIFREKAYLVDHALYCRKCNSVIQRGYSMTCHKCRTRHIEPIDFLQHYDEVDIINADEMEGLLRKSIKPFKKYLRSLREEPLRNAEEIERCERGMQYLHQFLAGDIGLAEEVYVYKRMNNLCTIEKHPIESVTAQTYDVRTGKAVNVNVYYCRSCLEYFVNYEALNETYFKRDIFPGLHFRTPFDIDRKLNEVSELMMYGYNVREGVYSKKGRQDVLASIMDFGLMSKNQIISKLQFFISLNSKQTDRENACNKWQQDIEFVSHYVENNERKINPVFMRKKNN